MKVNIKQPWEVNVTEAQKRADQLKSDIARLEGENERLESRLKKVLDGNLSEQRALLVFRDGRMKNAPLQIEPDISSRGTRPARFLYVMDAPLYPVASYVDPGISLSPYAKRTFEIAYNQPDDAKLIVYVER